MLNRLAPWSPNAVAASCGLWVHGSHEAPGDLDVLLGTAHRMAFELRLSDCVALSTLPPGHVLLAVGGFRASMLACCEWEIFVYGTL